MAYDFENDELAAECDQLLDDIDDIINDIGEILMGMANAKLFSECIETAKSLWLIMENHAREEDANDILEQFVHKTGISLNDN